MLGRFLFDNFQKILVGIIFWFWFVTVFLSDLSLGIKVMTFVGACLVSGLVGWYGAAFKAWYRGRKQNR